MTAVVLLETMVSGRISRHQIFVCTRNYVKAVMKVCLTVMPQGSV